MNNRCFFKTLTKTESIIALNYYIPSLLLILGSIIFSGCSSKDSSAESTNNSVNSSSSTTSSSTDRISDTNLPSANSDTVLNADSNEQNQSENQNFSRISVLNIESDTTPEGVTHHYMKAFFETGDKAVVRNYLTPKAQIFFDKNSIGELDTNNPPQWTITDVQKADPNNAYVLLDMIDYTDVPSVGSLGVNKMIFLLTQTEQGWKILGFTAENILFNLEDGTQIAFDDLPDEPAENIPNNSDILQISERPINGMIK